MSGWNKLSMPFLGSQNTENDIAKEDDSDYILVFYNPFQLMPGDTPTGLSATTVKKPKAEEMLWGMFHTYKDADTSEDEEFMVELRNKIKNFLSDQQETIPFDVFAEFGIGSIIWLLEFKMKLKVDLFKSRDNSKIFCKLRATNENLRIHADLIFYPLQFRSQPEDTKPFMKIPPYAPFKRNEESLFGYKAEHLYKNYNKFDKEVEEGEPFRKLDRIRLVHNLVFNYISVNELLESKLLVAEFPIHNEENLKPLRENLLGWRGYFKGVDVMQIRNYFGSKIGLYFAWLSQYIRWLIVPGILGVVAFILKATLDPAIFEDAGLHGDSITFAYCMMIAIAGTFFDQMWKREQRMYSLLWGQTSLATTEQQRRQFQGVKTVDPVTGKVKKISDRGKCAKYSIWLLVRAITLFMIAVVIACISGLFLFKASLSTWGQKSVAFLNAIQIKVFNFIYGKIALKLTDWENLETDTKWYNSLTTKLFVFQFVNSYNSLAYIAFFKDDLEGCEVSCLSELNVQLTIIFVTNFLLNIVELGMPLLKKKWNLYREKKTAKKNMLRNPWELQKRIFEQSATVEVSPTESQAAYEPYESPLEDYMEMVIQYGYIIMWSASFPLAPIIALFLNIIEVRVDGYKLTNIVRRPYPAGAKSIGNWLPIIRFLTVAGIFTNASIILFTSTSIDLDDSQSRWLGWLLTVNGLYILRKIIAAVIPDTPELFSQAITWQERIVQEKLYHRFNDIEKRRKVKGLYMKGEVNLTEFSREKISSVNRNK